MIMDVLRSGYSITKETQYRNPNGSWEADFSPAYFTMNTSLTGAAEIVQGYALVDNALSPAVVYGGGRLDTPFSFLNAGDGFGMYISVSGSQTDGNDYDISMTGTLI
jgi:hypothetical protein